MALTLNANLQTAQEAATRRPLVQIVSSQKESDVPFDGTVISSVDPPSGYEAAYDVPSTAVASLTTSLGRLINAYLWGPAVYNMGGWSFSYRTDLKVYYTNLDRTQFFTGGIEYIDSEYFYPTGLAMCEMSDGNIGYVWAQTCNGPSGAWDSPNEARVRAAVTTAQGVVAGPSDDGYGGFVQTTIFDGGYNDYWLSRPGLATIGTNSYYCIWSRVSLDGNHEPTGSWALYYSTSSDFGTWTSPLTTTISGLDMNKRVDNLYLFKAASGTLYLFFDYSKETGPAGEELRNIYFASSSNNGASWSSATKVTNYTTYSQVAREPAVVEKTSGEFTLVYNEEASALQMENSSNNRTGEITYDAENQKIYVTQVDWYNQPFVKITRIDIATWTVDGEWGESTTPAFPGYFYDANTHYVWSNNDRGDGYLIPVSIKSSFDPGYPECFGISLLNGQSNTITNYFFNSSALHGNTQNVTWTDPATQGEGFTTNSWIKATQVDKASNRLYVLLIGNYTYRRQLTVGYLDLTEVGPTYTFHQILTERDTITGGQGAGWHSFRVDPANDWIIYASDGAGIWKGCLRVWTLSAGLLARAITYDDNALFPWYGLTCLTSVGDKVYGGFKYQASYSQADLRGLCEVDILTGNVLFHRPGWASVDDYGIRQPKVGSGGTVLMIPCYEYGFSLFDTVSTQWTLFTNTNTPGLSPDETNGEYWTCCAWDSIDEMIIGGYHYGWCGIILFDDSGKINQLHSMVSSNSGSTWGAATQLTLGDDEFQPAVARDPSLTTAMYVFWLRDTGATNSYLNNPIKSVVWDKDGTGIDVSSRICSDEDVIIERSIEGNPAKLSFSIAEGHLFDPYNTASLLSVAMKKGRKLTVYFGEDYTGLGDTVWQVVGSFYVTEVNVSYERGRYTKMRVVAEDERTIWNYRHIYASDYYISYPEPLLEDVLKEMCALTDPRIDIANFDTRVEVEHQWTEVSVKDLIDQICSRFGYFYRFDVSNIFTCRKISVSNTIDHDYTAVYNGADFIIRYEPDDSFSDFTNKVTVTGQERDFIDVIYPEERIDTVRGTFGWYGHEKDYTIYYSKDSSRTCRYPRLVVIENTQSFMFRLGGNCDQYISSEDTVGFKYCVVHIEAPNLTMELIAAIGIVGVGLALGDMSIPMGGMTIPVGKVIESVGMISALMILGSIGNYQLEVWATPTGQVRRSVQNLPGTGEDLEAQSEMGVIVEKKIEDPLCYSASDCGTVADFEIMVAKAQRKRVRISKLADLRDEEGDTIKVYHPYTGGTITIFITNLTRRFRPGHFGQDGYFIDDIEGWVVDMGAVVGYETPAPPPKQDRSGGGEEGGGGGGSGVLGAYASSEGYDPQDERYTTALELAYDAYNGWWAEDNLPGWWVMSLGAGNGVAIQEVGIGAGYIYNGVDLDGTPTDFTIEGSMTGAFTGEQTTLYTATDLVWYEGQIKTFQFNNSTAFEYYRINITGTVGDARPWIYYIEGYVCDTGSTDDYRPTLPSVVGSFSTDSDYSGSYPASNLGDFDLVNETCWVSGSGSLPHWAQYDFGDGNAKVITLIRLYMPSTSVAPVLYNQNPKTVYVYGSNTGAFGGEEALLGNSTFGYNSTYQGIALTNSTAYRYYRVVVTETWNGGSNLTNICDIQFEEACWPETGDSIFYIEEPVGPS